MDLNVDRTFRNENANVVCLHFNHMLQQLGHRYAYNITIRRRSIRITLLRAQGEYKLSSMSANCYLTILTDLASTPTPVISKFMRTGGQDKVLRHSHTPSGITRMKGKGVSYRQRKSIKSYKGH